MAIPDNNTPFTFSSNEMLRLQLCNNCVALLYDRHRKLKATFTEADDGSLIPRQTHPADDTRFRRADGLLAVINAVNVSFIQTLQVRPETNNNKVQHEEANRKSDSQVDTMMSS